MMRSLYAATTALRSHQLRMDVVANNIANVNTVGYKASRVSFQDLIYQMLRVGVASSDEAGGVVPQQVGSGVAINSIGTSFTQGAVQPTGNATDLMIQGDGFFVLQDSAGDKYYTRAGVFGFDANGYLVNKANGMFVLNTDGSPIQVPDFNTVNSVTINARGEVVADGSVVATIGLAKVPNPEGLDRVGANLFKQAPASGEPQISAPGNETIGLKYTTIVPGALEMSNVDLALEFTEMITTQRGFQANARTITTSDEMLQELVNLKR